LNFGISGDFTVDVDSFKFCQNYKMTKPISSGGGSIKVELIKGSKEIKEFAFNSNDVETGELNLRDYILCYELLHDKIPKGIPHHDFFPPDKLTEVLLAYIKAVEYEGFYYEEYIAKNPNLTRYDVRTKIGWDFKECMKGRNIKD
jgi:hypothetical protein